MSNNQNLANNKSSLSPPNRKNTLNVSPSSMVSQSRINLDSLTVSKTVSKSMSKVNSTLNLDNSKSHKPVSDQKTSKSSEKEVRRFQFGRAPRKIPIVFDRNAPVVEDKSPLLKSKNLAGSKESIISFANTLSKESLHDLNVSGGENKSHISTKSRVFDSENNQHKENNQYKENKTSGVYVSPETKVPLIKLAPIENRFSFMDLLRTAPNDNKSNSLSADTAFYNDMKKVVLSITNSKPLLNPKINALSLKPSLTKLPEAQSYTPSLKEASSASSLSMSPNLRPIRSKVPQKDKGSISEQKGPERQAMTDREEYYQTERQPRAIRGIENLEKLKATPVLSAPFTSEFTLPRIVNHNEIGGPLTALPKGYKYKSNTESDDNVKKSPIFALDNLADAPFSFNGNNPIVIAAEMNQIAKKSLSDKHKGLSVMKKGTHQYSKAVLVKYFDQFETKIIQPEFMQKIGSMCITELWSSNNKLTYLQQMRGGISVYRNRHRDGENLESLFQPDKRHHQVKVDDHVRLNNLGVDDTRDRGVNPDTLTVETKALLKYRDAKDNLSTGNNTPLGAKSARDKPSPLIRAQMITNMKGEDSDYMMDLYSGTAREKLNESFQREVQSKSPVKKPSQKRFKELNVLGKSRRF